MKNRRTEIAKLYCNFCNNWEGTHCSQGNSISLIASCDDVKKFSTQILTLIAESAPDLKVLSDEQVIKWMQEKGLTGFIGDYYKEAQLDADKKVTEGR